MNAQELIDIFKKLNPPIKMQLPIWWRSLNDTIENYPIEALLENPLDSKNYEKTDSGVYAPLLRGDLLTGQVSYRFSYSLAPPPRIRMRIIDHVLDEETEETPFEVNMVEALIGWKAFYIYRGKLNSASFSTKWTPCEPLISKCHCGPSMRDPVGACKNSPQENGNCGIYAGDDREEAEKYVRRDGVIGPKDSFFLAEIYGWGRYVRGDSGWRSQFAYPKCFYLRPSQVEFIDTLRAFHVPIYIEQPVQVYNPEEDGYSEYRQNQENWDIGTAEDSDPTED